MHPGKHYRIWVGIGAAIAAFLVYARTLLPSVGYNDSGELAAAAHVLGNSHPTGYPLFSLLEKAFSLLPLGGTVIWRMNLLSALLCGVAVWLWHVLFSRLLARGMTAAGDGPSGQDAGARTFIAAAAALALGFSGTFWTEAATSIEVYALHLALLPLALILYLRALDDVRPGTWALFGYGVGLSFSNHLMTVLIAPALLAGIWFRFGKNLPWSRIAIATSAGLLGLSCYLYLPVRAALDPTMNWGDPVDPVAFWRHVTGAQFRDSMLSSDGRAGQRLATFFREAPELWGYVPLAFAIIGLWSLRRRVPTLAFSVLLFATCLAYTTLYNIPDFRIYFLQAHAVIGLWIACGLLAVLQWMRGWKAGAGSWFGRTALVASFVFPLFFNFSRADRSRDHAVEDFARNVLASVDSGAVLLTNEYWIINSPVDYLQQVERFRTDVVVIDVGLLGHDWFYDQLATRHPRLAERSRGAIEGLRGEIRAALAGRPNANAYNARLRALYADIVAKGIASGPVYVTAGIDPDMLPDYRYLPSGLVFRLAGTDDTIPYPPPRKFSFRPLPDAAVNPIAPVIRDLYAEGYGNQGASMVHRGDTATGALYLREALALQPDFPVIRELLQAVSPR